MGQIQPGHEKEIKRMKIPAKIGEETHELDLDQLELPETLALVDTSLPAKDRGFLTKAELDEIVQTRVNETKESVKRDLTSNENFTKLLEERGHTYDDTGLIVPLDDGKAKEARIAQYKRWRESELEPEVEKYKGELEHKSSRLNKYIESDLDRQLNHIGREAGIKQDLLQPLASGKTPLYYELRESGAVKHFEDYDEWLVADGDQPKLKHGKPQAIAQLIEEYKGREDKQWLFEDKRVKSANVSTRRPSQTGSLDLVEINEKLRSGEISRAEYLEKIRPQLK